MSQRDSILQSKLVFQRTPSKTTITKSKTQKEKSELVNTAPTSDSLDLTQELLDKASILKSNTLNFSNVLSSDQTIDKLSSKLENESIRLKKESSKISQLTSSSWTTTLLIWGSVIIVVITFILTFIFMRLFKVNT
jgi:hypothetical protein